MAALLLALTASISRAEVALLNYRVEAEYWGGVAIEEADADLSRFSLKPSARLQIGDEWRADLALRIEYAVDDTGLGTLDTYSRAARPLVDREHLRIEIDRATLTRRAGAGDLILGKQTVPWGVLDGIQITDRFDAVRRRDFVLTDVRPERLSRWGGRWRGRMGGIGIDAAILTDPTVSQLARRGDTFEPRAPRLRGGLPPAVPTPPVRIADRESYAKDATLGLRLQRRFGNLEASVLTLFGPSTEPVLQPIGHPTAPEVLLRFPKNRLHGATLEGSLGSAIWRFEAAYIPDQPVNVEGPAALEITERQRWLAGIGIDLNAPGGWFLNAQLAVDRVEGGRLDLTRPHEDVVGTLRVQRGFRHDTLHVRAELLGSLSDGDGVLRPMFEWRGHSHLRVAVGGDLLFGRTEGLFGQYREASRVWVRFRVSI